MIPFGVVVLAAGSSTRFGSPKQLAEWEGEPLVRRAAKAALKSDAAIVIVVVGTGENEITSALAGLDVLIEVNESWEEGMASSIRKGVQALPEEAGRLVILATDQPLITGHDISSLIECMDSTGQPIVAAAYDGILGVPAAFSSELFPELLNLRGDSGARSLIRNRRGVASVPMPTASVDIDVPGDLNSC